MNLYLDAGNTRTKWCIDPVAIRPHYGALTKQNIGELEAQLSRHLDALNGHIEQIFVASVAGVEFNQRLKGLMKQFLDVEPHFVEVKRKCGGVVAAYDDLSSLGVDRWLAMIAAYQTCRNACVVLDAGSALTADFVAADGTHKGGIIVPGLEMMLRSLTNTAEINIETRRLPKKWSPGATTRSCIESGVVAIIKGLLLEVERVAKPLGCRTVFMTGGDVESLIAYYGGEMRLEIAPNLVLDGLARFSAMD